MDKFIKINKKKWFRKYRWVFSEWKVFETW